MILRSFQRIPNGVADQDLPFPAPVGLPEGWVVVDKPITDAVEEFPQLKEQLKYFLRSENPERFYVDVCNVHLEVGQSIGDTKWGLINDPNDEKYSGLAMFVCQFGCGTLESLTEDISIKRMKKKRYYESFLHKKLKTGQVAVHPEGYFLFSSQTAPFRHTQAKVPGRNITIFVKIKEAAS